MMSRGWGICNREDGDGCRYSGCYGVKGCTDNRVVSEEEESQKRNQPSSSFLFPHHIQQAFLLFQQLVRGGNGHPIAVALSIVGFTEQVLIGRLLLL